MTWFGGLYDRSGQWLAALALALLGIAIELAQGLQVHRSFDLGDIAANLFGVLAALILVRSWWYRWPQRVEQRLTPPR